MTKPKSFIEKANRIYQGDCLEVMKSWPDECVDLILTDPPYGITACDWDKPVPFEPMWKRFKRVIKPDGAIVLTASQPFTSKLVMSNLKWFKYEWVWEKTRPTGFFTAKKMPMKIHENILVFYNRQPVYNPIKIKADESKIDRRKTLNPTYSPYLGVKKERVKDSGMRYPLTIQKFNSISKKGQHPTQKPAALMEYLIKTYTNKGDTVLDPFIGSGTTAVACKKLNRKYVGIELNPEYIKIANKRLAQRSLLK